MSHLGQILLFVALNVAGFLGIGLCYRLGFMTGLITPEILNANAAFFQQHFFTGSAVTWIVCAVFSVSSFFLENPARLFFLWAPVVIPFSYGLSVLLLSAS